MPCVISFPTSIMCSLPTALVCFLPLSLSLCLSVLKQLYTSSYTEGIASHQGNHGYFTEKQKQNEMKLENV